MLVFELSLFLELFYLPTTSPRPITWYCRGNYFL